MTTLVEPVVEKEVSKVFSEQYTKIIEDLMKETLNYQEILEKMKAYPRFSINTLIFCAKGLGLDSLAKELAKAETCLCVLNADSSVNLPSLLSDFGEEDFTFLIQNASRNGNEVLTRALQQTQVMIRAGRVSHYRNLFASNQRAAYEYLDSLSIITLVNLAEDLAVSLGNALHNENGSFSIEYALIVAKINDFVQAKAEEKSNIEYNAFLEERMLQFSTAV